MRESIEKARSVDSVAGIGASLRDRIASVAFSVPHSFRIVNTTSPEVHIAMLYALAHEQALANIEWSLTTSDHTHKRETAGKLEGWSVPTHTVGQEDVYISINPLYDWRTRRTNANVSQVCWLYVDLDCHNEDAPPDWALSTSAKVESEVFSAGLLPQPTAQVFSGRGLWYLWQIKPISSQYPPDMKRWHALMRHFAAVMQPYGADGSCIDVARLMRLAGSVNSKSGQRVSLRVDLDAVPLDIERATRDCLPRLLDASGYSSRRKPAKAKRKDERAVVVPLHTLYSLNRARCSDIETLVGLRDGDMSGVRNKALFLYALHMGYVGDSEEYTHQRTEELNECFTLPLRSSEVVAVVDHALGHRGEGWESRSLTYKTQTVVSWLDVTAKEQERMLTLIDSAEKKRRRQERLRAAGVRTFDEYKQARKAAQLDKLDNLAALLQEDPSATKASLAHSLGCSVATVKRLKRLLR